MSVSSPRMQRRPRKRPPLRSYIPFTVFCIVSTVLLVGLISLFVHLLPGHAGQTAAQAPGMQRQTQAISIAAAPSKEAAVRVAQLSGPRLTTHLPAATAEPTATFQTSGMPAPDQTEAISSTAASATPQGALLPTATPAPDGNASVVISRDVDNNGNPLLISTRFVSPALRLYAVVTLRTVSASDVLRFVFERNNKILPDDVITYTAGGTAGSHTFSAYADYANGTKSLPHGTYRLFFYRNGHLEVAKTFQVG